MGIIIKLKPFLKEANNNTAKVDYSYIKFTTKKKEHQSGQVEVLQSKLTNTRPSE